MPREGERLTVLPREAMKLPTNQYSIAGQREERCDLRVRGLRMLLFVIVSSIIIIWIIFSKKIYAKPLYLGNLSKCWIKFTFEF